MSERKTQLLLVRKDDHEALKKLSKKTGIPMTHLVSKMLYNFVEMQGLTKKIYGKKSKRKTKVIL